MAADDMSPAGAAVPAGALRPLAAGGEYEDDDEDAVNAAAEEHLLGASMRPDMLARARAMVDDDDELVMADEAGAAPVTGGGSGAASGGGGGFRAGSSGGSSDLGNSFGNMPEGSGKRTPGGITPMGVRPDRGQGPLGGAGAATLAEMDGALSDLNAWNDRRRREEDRMRAKLEA
jgi:hypothetical protein